MAEPLSERIKRAREEAAVAAARRQQRSYQSRAAEAARNMATLGRLVGAIAVGVQWAWDNVVGPLWRVVRKPLWRLLRAYLRLWDRVVIVSDPYGKPAVSRTRAGAMVFGTLLVWWYAVDPCLGLLWDSTLYALTAKRDETVILFSSQEIDSSKNRHNVEGCLAWPCADGESLYFRVQNSLFNNIWKLANAGSLFYPDYVAAAVPLGNNRCVITSYGLRSRLIVMNIEIFPEIIDVKSCEAVR